MPPSLEHVFGDRVARADPLLVTSYPGLVKTIARIAHSNPRVILLFRGQSHDFRNRGGSSTFYPAIYRGDQLLGTEIRQRFGRLEQAEADLIRLAQSEEVDGNRDIQRRQMVRWGILQHYEVCPTPLLDLTHSVRVACSFAQHAASREESSFVYAFAFPYLTNRISYNSEDDLVTVRLLSISPPEALRPFFQDGYLAGTTDVTTEFPDKSELDFNRRLLAKFEIPPGEKFWGSGLRAIPPHLLLPKKDRFRELVSRIEERAAQVAPGSLGEFMFRWQQVEGALLEAANGYEARLRTLAQAIETLRQADRISDDLALQLDALRRFRNAIVHRAQVKSDDEVWSRLAELGGVIDKLHRADIFKPDGRP